MKKILGILVTYNPDVSKLKDNISSIITQLDKLVVYDNNSSNILEIEEIKTKYNFYLYKSKINVGLGKAYNDVLNKEHSNFDFFITFDQDTFIPLGTIKILSDILIQDSKIGAVGPSFSHKYSLIKRGKIHYKKAIIQSSAIFRMQIYDLIGGFNESFFIDSIDFEYCLRINDSNYKVAIFDGIVIEHQLGEVKKIGKYSYITHNKTRVYYMARNHKYLTKSYIKSYPLFIFKKNIFFVVDILKILFLEKDLEKIKYLIKGLKY